MREQQNEQRGFFSALRLSGAILILTIGLVTHQSWSEGLPETGGEEETVRSAFATDKADQGRETIDVAKARGREVHEVAPKPMLEAVAAASERMNAARAEALREQYGMVEDNPAPPRGGRR